MILTLTRLLRLIRLVSLSKVDRALNIKKTVWDDGCVTELPNAQVVLLNAVPGKGDDKEGGFKLSVSAIYTILLAYLLCVALNLEVRDPFAKQVKKIVVLQSVVSS